MSEVFWWYNETLTTKKTPESYTLGSDFDVQEYWNKRRLQIEINIFREKQDNKKDFLEDLLKNNPNEKYFVYQNWKLIPFSKFNWNPRSDFFHIETRKSIEWKISILNESLSETRIDKEIKKLDNLIMWVHKDNPNIRLLLMEMRIQLSWYWKIDSYDFYWEELQDMLFFLEKQDSWLLSTSDYLWWAYNLFNFCRKHLAMDSKIVLAWVKDITSSRLYQYWEDNKAPFEMWLEDSIIWNDYIFDSAEPYVLETWKTLASTASWAIDWSLDYIWAVVDLNLVPDEVFMSFKELLPILLKDYKEIWNQILKWMTSVAEVWYIVWYVIWLILWAKFIPSPLVWWWVVKNTVTKLRSLNISENVISKIRTNLISAESWINNNISKYMPRIEALRKQTTQIPTRVTKWWKEVFDKWYDSVKYFNRWSSKEISASRKALDTATNSAILATIFWDKIHWQVDDITNTNFAMKIYEQQILNENDFLIKDVILWTHNTSWELQYNFIRVKERFTEIREIMDNEVMPLRKEFYFLKFTDMEGFKNLQQKIKNSNEYNELTKLIFKKYIK